MRLPSTTTASSEDFGSDSFSFSAAETGEGGEGTPDFPAVEGGGGVFARVAGGGGMEGAFCGAGGGGAFTDSATSDLAFSCSSSSSLSVAHRGGAEKGVKNYKKNV